MGEPKRQDPAATGKRERNKAENREAILAAARRVFAELGYEAATVRDVIGATELAAGTFYNYFPDKESVLRAVLGREMAAMQEKAALARRGAPGLEDVVRSTFRISFSVLAEDRVVFDLLRRNAGAVRVILGEPGFVANRDELADDLSRAIARDGGPPIDVEYLSAAITGVAFEVAAAAVDRQPADIEAAAEFATRLVLGGLAAAAPPQSRRKTSQSPRTRAGRPPAPKGAGARKKGKTTR